MSDYTKRRLAIEGFGSVLYQSFNSRPLAGLPQAYFDQAIVWMPVFTNTKAQRVYWQDVSQFVVGRLDWSSTLRRPLVNQMWKPFCLVSNGTTRPALGLNNESEFQLINDPGIGVAENSFRAPRSRNTFFWVPLFELLSGGSPTLSLPRGANVFGLPNQPLVQFWTSAYVRC